MNTTEVLGYAWPLVVSAGEEIAFHLSSPTLRAAEARLMRVRCGDPDPAGPGLKLDDMGSAVDGQVALHHQPIHPGSFASVDGVPALGSFSFGVFLWPTRPGQDARSIAAMEGWRFGLGADGVLELAVRSATLRATRPLIEREWVFVCASYDAATGTLAVAQQSLDPQGGRDRSEAATGKAAPGLTCAGTLTLARGFDGKLDRPRLYAAALDAGTARALSEALVPPSGDPRLIAAWDFSIDQHGDVARDLSAQQLHAKLHQMPTRAVTGANWDGRSQAWTEVPWQYGAIHFHSDDMADCDWSPDLTLRIPDDWRSGFYALRLCAHTGSEPVESFVPFFLRARQPKAKLAFVAATATFLAYANSALRLDQVHAESMLEGLIVLSRDDVYLQEHRELGLSTYDTHSDGSGWCWSTAKRPILNMRPRGNTFNYVNDTHILDWLEHEGFDYDIVTDEDIHREGARLLAPYACVITGSHPEYFSKQMLDAFDAYQRAGGRHMYLGGNGFYWRIAFHPTLPATMEIRRGMGGLRTWEGEAGEHNLMFTGEPSALWRHNGRPPQRLVGVGFDAQVFDRSAAYRRLPDSFDPRAAFIFEGIGPDDPIGEKGLRGGGAAGLEVDRADATLGSSPNLLLVATADRLGTGGLPAPEELRTLHRGFGGEENARVRADMIFTPTANGGAVFATGSIAWACALSCDGYTNSAARVTGNVLRRFLDPAPFDGFES